MSGRCVYTSLPAHHLEPEELLQMFSVREKHTIWCFVLKAHSVLSATSYLVWQVVTFLREKRKKKTDKYNFNQNVFTSSQHGRSLVKVKLSLALGRVACILWTLHACLDRASVVPSDHAALLVCGLPSATLRCVRAPL